MAWPERPLPRNTTGWRDGSSHYMYIYADDSTLYLAGTNTDDLYVHLEHELKLVKSFSNGLD